MMQPSINAVIFIHLYLKADSSILQHTTTVLGLELQELAQQDSL